MARHEAQSECAMSTISSRGKPVVTAARDERRQEWNRVAAARETVSAATEEN